MLRRIDLFTGVPAIKKIAGFKYRMKKRETAGVQIQNMAEMLKLIQLAQYALPASVSTVSSMIAQGSIIPGAII